MANIKKMANQYGEWKVLKRDPKNGSKSICQCSCGTIKSVDNYTLRNGGSKSCGCLERPLKKDITGKKFGKLTVLKPIIRGKGKVRWLCQCDCGNEHSATTSNLIGGNVLSCGCSIKSHGLSKHKLYDTWTSMMARCYNTKHKAYHRYGGRGILVYKEWHDVKNFIKDMSPKPKGMSIDRIDNDGNYSPQNCRWANAKQQRLNQKYNLIMVTLNGETKCIADWIKELNLTREVYNRIDRLGWEPERALLEPIKHKGK